MFKSCKRANSALPTSFRLFLSLKKPIRNVAHGDQFTNTQNQHARLHSIGKEKEGSRTSRLTSLQGWQGHERRIWTYFDTCSLQTEWYRSYCIIRSFQRQIERACSKLHYCLCLNISLGHIRSSDHHSVKDKVIIGYFKFPIKEEASIPYQLAHHHRHSPCHNRILSFVPLARLLHLWFWGHLGKFNL